MDVASSFAVSIAPPPFQKEVEEARRDTQNRVSIPKTKEMGGSTAQGQIADGRGNTDGENSLLNAQQQGILDADRDLAVDPDGRRKQNRQNKQNQDEKANHQHDEEEDDEIDEENAYNDEQYDVIADDSERNLTTRNPRAGHFNPNTGYYEIPASRFYKSRSILLKFREQNVKFLDHFSDKNTAVGLINYALTRRYGSIIPHSRLGQVVERMA